MHYRITMVSIVAAVVAAVVVAVAVAVPGCCQNCYRNCCWLPFLHLIAVDSQNAISARPCRLLLLSTILADPSA